MLEYSDLLFSDVDNDYAIFERSGDIIKFNGELDNRNVSEERFKKVISRIME